MSDGYFRQILGISPSADKEEIKRAYRRLVMENHPDRFPPDRKPAQELRIVTLNEAYSFLMSWVELPPKESRGGQAEEEKTRPRRQTGDRGRAGPSTSLGGHKDPAYAYYKQGFLKFSLALHGIAMFNEKISPSSMPGYKPYRVVDDFKTSLELLAAAHGYFRKVVDEHPGSVWDADARMKLRRIEGFTAIYRKILKNLGAKDA